MPGIGGEGEGGRRKMKQLQGLGDICKSKGQPCVFLGCPIFLALWVGLALDDFAAEQHCALKTWLCYLEPADEDMGKRK